MPILMKESTYLAVYVSLTNRFTRKAKPKGTVTLCNFSCNLSRNAISIQTFSHYETNCFTNVTLSNVSCNLSRFCDQKGSKEPFHWLRHKLQNRCYTAQWLKHSLQPLRKVELNSTFRNGFLQLVSERFWPLQGNGVLHWKM